jgi:hypothetical protein
VLRGPYGCYYNDDSFFRVLILKFSCVCCPIVLDSYNKMIIWLLTKKCLKYSFNEAIELLELFLSKSIFCVGIVLATLTHFCTLFLFLLVLYFL